MCLKGSCSTRSVFSVRKRVSACWQTMSKGLNDLIILTTCSCASSERSAVKLNKCLVQRTSGVFQDGPIVRAMFSDERMMIWTEIDTMVGREACGVWDVQQGNMISCILTQHTHTHTHKTHTHTTHARTHAHTHTHAHAQAHARARTKVCEQPRQANKQMHTNISC